MTYEEFDLACKAADIKSPKRPADNELEELELVHEYYPGLEAEQGMIQLAKIYSEFGMSIVRDMKWRAQRIKEAREHVRNCETELKEAKKALAELELGGNL